MDETPSLLELMELAEIEFELQTASDRLEMDGRNSAALCSATTAAANSGMCSWFMRQMVIVAAPLFIGAVEEYWYASLLEHAWDIPSSSSSTVAESCHGIESFVSRFLRFSDSPSSSPFLPSVDMQLPENRSPERERASERIVVEICVHLALWIRFARRTTSRWDLFCNGCKSAA